MKILGIDPGIGITGFGVIDTDGPKPRYLEAGVISTTPNSPTPERLAIIYDEITQLIEETRPDVLAIEILYFGNNVTTAFSVGAARGVVMLAAAQAGLPIAEFTPMQVKMSVTGYGRAAKRQIQEMVKMLLALKDIPRPDDAADALAVALTCAQSTDFEAIRA